MKIKLIVTFLFVIFLSGCSSLKVISIKANDYKKMESQTSRGLLKAGPLSGIPESTSQSVISDIDAGKCDLEKKVVVEVKETSILGFVYKTTGEYSCNQ